MQIRITKLHIILLIFLSGGIYCAYYFWNAQQEKIQRQLETAQREQARLEQLAKQKIEEDAKRKAAEFIVVVTTPPAALIIAQPPIVPKKQARKKSARHTSVIYMVKKGDTLQSIACHFGLVKGWRVIWQANQNQIRDVNRIEIGQKLVIPLPKSKSPYKSKKREST